MSLILVWAIIVLTSVTAVFVLRLVTGSTELFLVHKIIGLSLGLVTLNFFTFAITGLNPFMILSLFWLASMSLGVHVITKT